MQINCSCCLISLGNSAWFPPTGAPPKPTGQQGSPTRPAGAGHERHSCHSWQSAPSHTHVSKLTHAQTQGHKHKQTNKQTGDTKRTQLSSRLLPKNSLRGRSLAQQQNGVSPQGRSISLQQSEWLRVTCSATNIANIRCETDASQSTFSLTEELCNNSATTSPQPGCRASRERGSMAEAWQRFVHVRGREHGVQRRGRK